MKIMVSGFRLMGVCQCPPHVTPCGIGAVARRQVDSALSPVLEVRILRGRPIELLHGEAEGADALVAEYWERFNLGPVQAFPANWSALGKRAGAVRNGLMVAMMPDLVIGFPWAKRSRGTRDALRQARDAGIETRTFVVVDVCPHAAARIDY